MSLAIVINQNMNVTIAGRKSWPVGRMRVAVFHIKQKLMFDDILRSKRVSLLCQNLASFANNYVAEPPLLSYDKAVVNGAMIWVRYILHKSGFGSNHTLRRYIRSVMWLNVLSKVRLLVSLIRLGGGPQELKPVAAVCYRPSKLLRVSDCHHHIRIIRENCGAAAVNFVGFGLSSSSCHCHCHSTTTTTTTTTTTQWDKKVALVLSMIRIGKSFGARFGFGLVASRRMIFGTVIFDWVFEKMTCHLTQLSRYSYQHPPCFQPFLSIGRLNPSSRWMYCTGSSSCSALGGGLVI